MMGSCIVVGMFFAIFGMLIPFIAIGAVIYLVVAKQQTTDLHEAH